jgi:hypothetical protein
MATAALALNTWRVQFYETMAAAERARLDVRIKKETSGINLYDRFWLVLPLSLLLYFMKVLLTRLAALEAQPSSFLLERDAAKMPQSLSELFRKMCDLLQKAHEEALHRSRLLGRHIAALEKFTQELGGFAARFEDAQQKLLSRVTPEEAEHYREVLEAYKNCELKTEQATEEDVKTEAFRF